MQDAKSKIEEIQARRDAMRAPLAAKEQEQHLVDMEALADAEEEHGFGCVKPLKVHGYKEGVATFAIIKSPGGTAYYRRYLDQLRNAKKESEKGKAQELLGESCVIYPPKGEEREAMLSAFPGFYICAAIEACKMAELSAEDEKKD